MDIDEILLDTEDRMEKAVQILLDDLQKHPLPIHKKPAYPVYK